MANSINKQVLNKAISIAGSSAQEFKSTKACEQLSMLGFGTILGSRYTINNEQRSRLRDWLISSHGIDWKKGTKVFAGTRTTVSRYAINGKLNSQSVKRDWVKLKPLRLGIDQVVLNGQIINLPNRSHIEIGLSEIDTIELGCVLMVENLETFNDISEFDIASLLPDNIMVVYRGDPQTTGGMRLLKRLMDEEPSINSVWFSDFDPAGIEMALASKCRLLLLPELSSLESIKGDKDDFSNQYLQLTRLRSKNLSSELAPYIDYLDKRKEGFTQERMFAKQVRLQLVTL